MNNCKYQPCFGSVIVFNLQKNNHIGIFIYQRGNGS